MPLYAVSLLFSLEVQSLDAPEALQELTVHVLSAPDENGARARGEAIGRARETSFKNRNGQAVQDIFKAVVEVQLLIDDQIFDGIEAASWMFRRGECLVIDDRGITAKLLTEK